MEINFTHGSYLELLAHLRSLDYAVGSFHDVADKRRFTILRHDVDFSLQRALVMAQLDRQAGVTSTFFILLTAPYLNVLCGEGTALVREISGLGHEIGLHIDLTGYDLLSPEQQQRNVAHLAGVLSDVADCPITTIAQHKPASTLIRVQHPGYMDAYEDRYYKDIGYISDSRRQFVKPDVYGFFRENARSQMLIHPIWWTAEEKTRTQIFRELAAEVADGAAMAFTAEDARIEARIQAALHERDAAAVAK